MKRKHSRNPNQGIRSGHIKLVTRGGKLYRAVVRDIRQQVRWSRRKFQGAEAADIYGRKLRERYELFVSYLEVLEARTQEAEAAQAEA